MDLAGEIGGVYEVIYFVIGVSVLPISNFSYLIKSIQTLYLIKTKEKALFNKAPLTKKNT